MVVVAVCIETPTRFERRTIAAGAALPFGTLCELTDNNTVQASSTVDDQFGGIIWTPSISTDTFTEVTVAMDGLWGIMTDSGTDTRGTVMKITTANTLGNAGAADLLTGTCVGKLTEDSSGAAVTNVRVGSMV